MLTSTVYVLAFTEKLRVVRSDLWNPVRLAGYPPHQRASGRLSSAARAELTRLTEDRLIFFLPSSADVGSRRMPQEGRSL
jgi:hypothetical protein